MAYADQLPPQVAALPLSLALVSAVSGILLMLQFRVASNPVAIRQAKRRVQAQLLALRLFGDEPALVWRAQGRLLTANLRYLGAMLLPVAAGAIPFLLVFPHLQALYGRAPVAVGDETVLTLRMRKPLPLPLPQPLLEIPVGLRADAASVRVRETGEISWRLQGTGPVSEPVRIRLGDADVSKSVQVGIARGYLAETRPAGVFDWLANPGETPIGAPVNAPAIESIHVAYRGLRLSAFGLEWPWEAWFLTISAVVALLAKNRLGVVF